MNNLPIDVPSLMQRRLTGARATDPVLPDRPRRVRPLRRRT